MRSAPFVLIFLAAACGGGAPDVKTSAASQHASPAGVERYFPLEEGRVYAYVTDENGEVGMLVARVRRTDAAHGELHMSNATRRFVYGPRSVSYESGVVILREPLEPGISWPGEHGGTTRIESNDVALTVPAGSFSSCVETVEEGGTPPMSRYASTYCPGVGLVRLTVTTPGAAASALLKSYAPPISL